VAIPFSEDLRSRILHACKSLTQTKVSLLFLVNRKTVYNILAQYTQDGHVEPKKDYQKGHSHKFKTLDDLRKLIESSPQMTLKEMAKIFDVSISTIHRYLKKLGITKKKSHRNTLNEMKKNVVFFKKNSS
jgi:transposase